MSQDDLRRHLAEYHRALTGGTSEDQHLDAMHAKLHEWAADGQSDPTGHVHTPAGMFLLDENDFNDNAT